MWSSEKSVNLFVFGNGVHTDPNSKTWIPENAASLCTCTHTHTQKTSNKQQNTTNIKSTENPKANQKKCA